MSKINNQNQQANQQAGQLTTPNRTKARIVANVRERRRMRQMSQAYQRLRQLLAEWIPLRTKLSKKDTLVLTAYRIRYLERLAEGDLQGAKDGFRKALDDLNGAKLPWLQQALPSFDLPEIPAKLPVAQDNAPTDWSIYQLDNFDWPGDDTF